MTEYSDYSSLQQPSGGYGSSVAPSSAFGAGPSVSAATLAFADSDDGGGSAGGSSSSPKLPSPYPAPADPGLIDATKGDKLSDCFLDLTKKKPFDHLKLALVDLTGAGQGAAPYVGHKDSDLTFVASTAKIALILPAFALREAARGAAAVLMPPLTPANFLDRLIKDWDSEFRRGFRLGKAANTKPDLKAILAAKKISDRAPLKVDFTMQQNEKLRKAGFRPRLILALAVSDNDSASLCIDDLGFPYIHEAHRAAGVDGKDGLKLNLNFGKRTWDPSFGGGEHATARWIAELLVLIARDRLVANGFAPEVRDVMDDEFGDLATGINNRLPDAEGATLSYQGKIGYIKDKGPFGDCAIIRRTTAKGTMLCYVAVALGGKSHDEIKEAGAALDDCILAAHGEPPKPAPSP